MVYMLSTLTYSYREVYDKTEPCLADKIASLDTGTVKLATSKLSL